MRRRPGTGRWTSGVSGAATGTVRRSPATGSTSAVGRGRGRGSARGGTRGTMTGRAPRTPRPWTASRPRAAPPAAAARRPRATAPRAARLPPKVLPQAPGPGTLPTCVYDPDVCDRTRGQEEARRVTGKLLFRVGLEQQQRLGLVLLRLGLVLIRQRLREAVWMGGSGAAVVVYDSGAASW
jgi:hypothetical protein